MQYIQEMDISLEDLAEVFEEQNWQWATNGVYGIPDADDLGIHIWHLLACMSEDKVMDFVRSGRIILFRDPEFPGSYEIALQIGYLSEDEPTMEALDV